MSYSVLKFRKDILGCTDLTAEEKFILSSVIVMNCLLSDQGKSCQVPTDHFAKTYGMSIERVGEVIESLKKKNYFTYKVVSTIGGDVCEYSLNEDLDTRFSGCLPENRKRRSRRVLTEE